MKKLVKGYLNFLSAVGASIILQACIDPIYIETDQDGKQVVVDGLISTHDEQYSVRLFESSRYGSNPNDVDLNNPINNAQMFVIDDEGNSVPFTNTAVNPGIYFGPEDFKAVPGKSYKLEFTLNGKKYETDFEKVPQPVEPDSIYHRFDSEEDLISVFVATPDPGNTKNYYMWRWDGYFLFFSNIPDEIACCSRCYRYTKGTDILVYDDYLTNGNQIKDFLITKLPVDRPTNYLVQLRQYSINESTFDYLNRILTQFDQNGDIFDIPPYKIRGNIKSSDPEEEVLGQFIVSSSGYTFRKIERAPYYTRPIPIYLDKDCRTYVNADTLRPINW